MRPLDLSLDSGVACLRRWIAYLLHSYRILVPATQTVALSREGTVGSLHTGIVVRVGLCAPERLRTHEEGLMVATIILRRMRHIARLPCGFES